MPHEDARAGRLRLPLEVEDLLLAAWVAGGSMALRWATPGVEQGHDPTWVGWVLLGLAWAFLIVTRGPEDDDRDVAIMRRVFLVGPAYPLLSLYALAGTAIQRRCGGAHIVAASGEPPWPGPLVARVWRRTAAIPFMVIGDAVFSGSREVSLLRAGVMDEPFVWVGLVAVYVFTVAGPRIVAGASLSPISWAIRLALFLVATVWSLRQTTIG